MTLNGFLALYCVAIVLVSLLGGSVPIYVRLTHRRMQLANSLVAGFMLGVALLILLPHAFESVTIGTAMGWLIAGLLVMFFLERFFCYHHHDVPEGTAIETDGHHHVREVSEPTDGHAGHDHGHGHKLSWTGAATGLVLHSLIDGLALAAAVFAEPARELSGWWPGLAVFAVVALHRPLDAMTLLTLTAGDRWSQRGRHALNALFALAVPLGAALFLFGISGSEGQSTVVGGALAFAAGVFLCVSLSDLLPELQFHSHDRVKLSAALLLGLALAVAVHWGESATHEHDHGHPHDGGDAPAQHSAALHD